MPGKIDWAKARCRGINPEVFYLEESQLWDRKMSLKVIRKVCFSCPIRQECLNYALEKGEHGTWGGLSEWERTEVIRGRNDVRFLQSLRRDIAAYGLTLKEALGEWYERAYNH